MNSKSLLTCSTEASRLLCAFLVMSFSPLEASTSPSLLLQHPREQQFSHIFFELVESVVAFSYPGDTSFVAFKRLEEGGATINSLGDKLDEGRNAFGKASNVLDRLRASKNDIIERGTINNEERSCDRCSLGYSCSQSVSSGNF
ncbi:unnamed protein product [Prunus armeniaca]